MLWEIRQSQKHKYCMISIIGDVLNSQINKIKDWHGGYQRLERGGNGLLINRHKVSIK